MTHDMSKTKEDSLSDRAYAKVKADILACRLAPGQKLKISDIVAELGYSLGAVREALSRLTSEGLVVPETNKGYRVAPITQAELEDLTRTRILIEGECLRSAIRNGDLKWESGIVSSLFELSRLELTDPADPERVNAVWAETHRRFHQALVAACDSPWLLRIREMLYTQSERYRSFSVPLDRATRDLQAEHKAIADAALARDADSAVAAMADHLALTTRIIINASTIDEAIKAAG